MKKQIFIQKNNYSEITGGPVTKLKNLSDVHLILLGAVENDFQLVIQKESYEITSGLLKLLGGENQHSLGKLIFENWPKCASVGCIP